MPLEPSNSIRYRAHNNSPTSGQAELPGRLGIHYFQDSFHYREADLQIWLPELASLGVSWLILEAETGRAIPESFINGIISNGIKPVLRFNLPTDQLTSAGELQTLLEVYAKWGIQYISFFDRPNSRSAWSPASWAQQDLVERFLDRFIPAADQALTLGVTPIFPALEPGGSYWDTAFLRTALQSMLRRKQDRLAHSMALSAYAWTAGKSLDWGSGGPDRWPHSRPYSTPEGSQDQRGFRVYEWYQSVAYSVLRENRPIFLFQSGAAGAPAAKKTSLNLQDSLNIARLLAGEKVISNEAEQDTLDPIHPSVVCSASWLLSSVPGHIYEPDAWYTPEGKANPIAETIRNWRARAKVSQLGVNRIRHYLLLPAYEWGIDEVHLEAIRPFLRKYRPAVGFSIEEAVLADSVTVIGDELAYTDEALNRLRQAGCRVERIQGDGTTIASLLAER